MLKMLIEAFWGPFRYYKLTLLLIVPFVLIELIATGVGFKLFRSAYIHFHSGEFSELPPRISSAVHAVEVMLVVVFTLVYASTVVRFHQKIILGHSDGYIRFNPTRIEINYALYLVAMIVLIAGLSYGGFLFAAIIYVQFYKVLDTLSGSLITQQPYLFTVVTWCFVVVIILVFLQLVIRVAMSFPRVAIDQDKYKWTGILRKQTSIFSRGGMAILLVGVTASLPLYGMEWAGGYLRNPPELQTFQGAMVFILLVLFQLYWLLTMAGIQSVVYRDRIMPYLLKN